MKLIRYPQIKPLKDKSCVTVGNFDGVHLGHQTLINETVRQARLHDLNAVVVTMQPLPQQFFSGKFNLCLLSDLRLKYQLIRALGVDVLCVLNFNQRLSELPAYNFYKQILHKGLNSQRIILGDDFRFGHNRSGGFDELSHWGREDDVLVSQLDSILTDNHLRISSTQIREHLEVGDFATAKQMLGRDFNLIGRVAHGRKKGRELGFPTANIELKSGGFPLHGIYFSAIKIQGTLFPSVTSVGYNPSVGGNAKRVEVHILDFNREIYGQTVEVLFYKKWRNEVEFGSLTELTRAIAVDVKAGREFFLANNVRDSNSIQGN